ncbi:MAG: hypothetical protein ACK2UQ_17845 [Anaerolineae bacterium]|jgi:hypothetical protein
MSVWLWLLAGLLVGVLNVATIAGTVGRLGQGGELRALSTVMSGFVLRLALSIFVLVVALRQSAAAGLLAFAGIWLGRWTVLLWTHVPAGRCKVET